MPNNHISFIHSIFILFFCFLFFLLISQSTNLLDLIDGKMQINYVRYKIHIYLADANTSAA